MNDNMRKKIIEILAEDYAGAECGLKFNSPFELLISTILSAQCTDERVNKVTEIMYKKCNTPEKMIEIGEEGISDYIKSCGFYRVKSKNIFETSKKILLEYGGEVPKDMETLTKLPGVGRKTANVVMSNAYGIPAIAVDTHVFRVSNRLGLAKGKTVEEVEEKLMKNIPKKLWSDCHHYIIWHGRKVCNARKPKCDICNLKEYCEYYKKQI